MISRQLLCTTVVYQCQSVHSSLVAPSMRGIVDLRRRRIALGVVPDEQHPVLLQRGPGSRCGPAWARAGVGHLLASPVAAPAPVVERAGDLVALDLALREVTAHVPAVGVEHVDACRPPLRKTTSFCPKALIACGLPSPKSLIKPRQCQPRANRVGAACASMSRTSSASDCDVIVDDLTPDGPASGSGLFHSSGWLFLRRAAPAYRSHA